MVFNLTAQLSLGNERLVAGSRGADVSMLATDVTFNMFYTRPAPPRPRPPLARAPPGEHANPGPVSSVIF